MRVSKLVFGGLLALSGVIGCDGASEASSSADARVVDGGGGSGGEGGSGGGGSEGGSGGEGAAGGSDAPIEGRYAMSVEVRTPAGGVTASYIQILDGLPADGVISNDAGIEIGGIGRVFAYGDWIFMAEAADPVLRRYTLADDGSLVEAGEIGFASTGVTFFTAGFKFIAPDKAYYFSNELLEVIVFDPTTLTITGRIDYGAILREGFEGADNSAADPQAIRDGILYAPITYANYFSLKFGRGMSVAMFDTATDTFLGVIEDDRCDGAGATALGEDGAIYVHGNNVFNFLPATIDDPLSTCVLRIPADSMAFDPDYRIDTSELTGGLQTTSFVFGSLTRSWAMALRADLVESSRDLARGSVLELWELNLEAGSGKKIANTPLSSLFVAKFFRHADAVFTGLSETVETSTIHRLDIETGEVRALFDVQGLFRALVPLP